MSSEPLLQMQGVLRKAWGDAEISNHEKNLSACKNWSCCAAARFLIMEELLSQSGLLIASY